jgi:hypothetical protein
MPTLPLAVFFCAMALAAFAVIAHLIVFLSLRRQGVPFSFGLSSLPGYLAEKCKELPQSPRSARLLKLERWSSVAFGLAVLGAIVSGPLLSTRSGSGA